MISVIVVTHGQFGQELVRTAENIVGRQEGVVALGITPEMGIETLAKALDETLVKLKSEQGVLFFVDMLGGTPCNTVLLKTKNLLSEVVTGVNLYMLISSLTHRSELNLRDLALKVCEDGRKAIALPKDLLAQRGA